MWFLINYCENVDFLTIVKFFLKITDVIFFIVPIILIVMVTIDFGKTVISGTEDDMKKNVQLVLKRIIYAIAIFLVPTIVRFSMSLLGSAGLSYATCITNATDKKIAELKQIEQQKEQSNKNNSTTNSESSSSTNNSSNNNSESSTSNNNTSANGNNSNSSTSTTVDNTSKKTGVDFSKVYSCGKGTVIGNNNGVKLRECSSNYQTKFFQNFAITDNYIYFSILSAKTKNSERIHQNRIVRISKTTGKYQSMYINYAGHAQCFDVASNYTNTSLESKKDRIFLNYFTGYKSGTIPPELNSGVTYSTFEGKATSKGSKKIPELGIAIKKSNNKPSSLVLVTQNNYIKNGKFDSDSYNKKIKQIGNSAGNTYFANLQISVDETHNQILLFDPRTEYQMGYVYKLDDFLEGRLTLIASVHIDLGYGQGVEIYGNYIYHIRGYKTVYLRKYNIKTGKMVKYIEFDLNNYGSNEGKKLRELEGITVYKGNVYIALNYKKANKNYALIAYLDGV